jgi:hypothetical protein
MEETVSVKTALKRGALVSAANWQVMAIQFVGESTFKVLLSIPVVGGALLVALVLGHDLPELLNGDIRTGLTYVASALLAEPVALGAFLSSFALVALAGSVLMFLIKGGTITVMAQAERQAGPIEHPPLRLPAFMRAARFGLEPFKAGCATVFRRYLRLGLLLILVYVLSAAAYLGLLYLAYVRAGSGGLGIKWTAIAGLGSTLLAGWISLVNFLYVLVQIAVVVEDQSVRTAARHVARFLRSEPRVVFGVVGVVLALVVVATIVSLIATTSLSLIAFVPVAGLAVVPLQLLAWLFRGVVFQFLDMSSIGAYLYLYRRYAARAAGEGRAPSFEQRSP